VYRVFTSDDDAVSLGFLYVQ